MKLTIRVAAFVLLLLIICSATAPQAKAQSGGRDSDARSVEITRQPRASRTHIMPRSQTKYSLFHNYAWWWIDRPLFHDRSLRYPTGRWQFMNYEDVVKRARIVQSYEIDGLANLAISGSQHTNYLRMESLLSRSPIEDMILYPEYSGRSDIEQSRIDRADIDIKTARNSRFAFRIDGRVVMSSYGAGSLDPEEVAQLVNELRKRNGDTFYFVCDLRDVPGRLNRASRGDVVPPERYREAKEQIRRYLKAADGIMYSAANHLHDDRDPAYDDRLNTAFYANVLVPLFHEVLAEPGFEKKLFGLSAALGYVNHRSGTTQSEEGTKNLRNSLEITIAARPDFIMMPEWDEVNENTCLRPTVYNSLTSQRILKYYMRKLKGQPPAPNLNDDTTVPNLVISYRRWLKVGEILDIELLNVPDTEEKQRYTVVLELKDIDGRLIRRMPEAEFVTNTLRDVTFEIPTETLAEHRVIVPSLNIRTSDGKTIVIDDGLLYCRLHPTYTWIYQYVKQPIRDVLRSSDEIHAELSARPLGDEPDDGVEFHAEIRCDEDITQMEILEDGREIYAHDRLDEFKVHDNHVFRMSILSPRTTYPKGTITVENTDGLYARPFELANGNFTGFRQVGNVVHIEQRINTVPRGLYLAVPKKDADRAVMVIDIEEGTFRVPIRDIIDSRGVAHVFDNLLQMHVDWFPKAPDTPVHYNYNRADFRFVGYPERRDSVFHLRVITKSGKIFRTRPMKAFRSRPGPAVPVTVFSETAVKPVTVEMPESHIPDIEYAFSPGGRDLIMSDDSYYWTGELGGGFDYGEPFNRVTSLPESPLDSTPQWVEHDGTMCLKFDGVAQYVVLPAEALPRGSFRLTFEIKPTADKDQVLFRHYGMRVIASLSLVMRGGELVASYVDNEVKQHDFSTGLKIPSGRWSRIEVVYDMQTISFIVNGERRSFPLSARPLYFAPSIFGGHTEARFGVEEDDEYFEGYLRALRIRHAPQE